MTQKGCSVSFCACGMAFLLIAFLRGKINSLKKYGIVGFKQSVPKLLKKLFVRV